MAVRIVIRGLRIFPKFEGLFIRLIGRASTNENEILMDYVAWVPGNRDLHDKFSQVPFNSQDISLRVYGLPAVVDLSTINNP
jgi:hypothetical protein